MRVFLATTIAMLLMAVTAAAQTRKIYTVDTEGNPVAYASIADENGKMVGVTGLDGSINIDGQETLHIHHVAFKGKTVKTSAIANNRITLEDAGFSIDEIQVKPKEMIYVQTYYRIVYLDKEGVMYYRAGLVDNAYTVKTKKIAASEDHISKAQYGIVKTVINSLIGKYLKMLGQLPEKSTVDNIQKGHLKNRMTLTEEEPGRMRVDDKKSTLGYVVNDQKDHLQRVSIDWDQYRTHLLEEKTDKKSQEKLAKRAESTKDERFYEVYRIDEDGRSAAEDFVMRQFHHITTDSKGETDILYVETFATDRAYVTKQELKERKKKNKIKLTYAALKEFERQNDIPALPDAMQSGIQKLYSKKEK